MKSRYAAYFLSFTDSEIWQIVGEMFSVNRDASL